MFVLRIKKGIPLKILNEVSGDVIEIHVPDDFKNAGMRVALKLPKNHKILHTKQLVGESRYDDESTDSKFNR